MAKWFRPFSLLAPGATKIALLKAAEDTSNTKNKKGDRSPRGLIIFVLHMYKQLTHEQRYVIYLGLQEGKSQKAIAGTSSKNGRGQAQPRHR